MLGSNPCIRVATLFLGVGLSVLACAKSPTGPIQRSYTSPAVDASPVWSPDGRLIAFHRRVFSSAGPPGVYVVPSEGGPMKYVAPGDFFWPVNLRFSPDGTRLVGCYVLQLYIIDIASATYWPLLYTTNGANYPDWSPDGRLILYSRAGYNPNDIPIDSAGIHYIDLTTCQDHVIPSKQQYPVYFGRCPLWSRDGSEFAFLESRVDGHNLAIVKRDGSGYQVLSASPPNTLFNYLHSYHRPTRGMDGFIFGPWNSSGHRVARTSVLSQWSSAHFWSEP